MSSKLINQKNTAGSVNTTTFDCVCGLKVEKTCPKAVALQKRLHLSKCEAGRIAYEIYKQGGKDKLHKYSQTTYNARGTNMRRETIFTTEGNAYGGRNMQ
jgi:hypothetical protein